MPSISQFYWHFSDFRNYLNLSTKQGRSGRINIYVGVQIDRPTYPNEIIVMLLTQIVTLRQRNLLIRKFLECIVSYLILLRIKHSVNKETRS